jgi:HAD superfamily hydrolase (TIGR01458 family)
VQPPRGLLIDLDGVVYDADRPIPGAAEAIAAIRRRRVPLLFVTNTTSRPRAALVEKLGRFGIPATADDLWTPAAAARSWLGEHVRGPVAVFTPEALLADFAGLELLDGRAESGAAAVVIGDLGERWDFPTLNRAFRLLHSNPQARLAALGMTRYWKSADGVSLDVAPFVKALEHASDRQAVVLGKPAEEYFRAAAEKLGLPPGDLLMIGDDIQGDVGGAQRAGLRGALVRTGKFREADLRGEIEPDAVLTSLAEAPGLFEELSERKI